MTSTDSTTQFRYIVNPDVVLREEEDEGALLYNPETDQVKLINSTGLFIWQQCKDPKDLSTIVTDMRQSYQEVPEDKISEEIQIFMDNMVESGFIGILEE